MYNDVQNVTFHIKKLKMKKPLEPSSDKHRMSHDSYKIDDFSVQSLIKTPKF